MGGKYFISGAWPLHLIDAGLRKSVHAFRPSSDPQDPEKKFLLNHSVFQVDDRQKSLNFDLLEYKSIDLFILNRFQQDFMEDQATRTIITTIEKPHKPNFRSIEELRKLSGLNHENGYDSVKTSLLPYKGILSPDKKSAFLIILQQTADMMLVNFLLFSLREAFHIGWNSYYAYLHSLVSLAVPFIFYQTYLYRSWRGTSALSHLPKIVYAWGLVATSLMAIGYFTKTTYEFSRLLTLLWAVVTPLAIFLQHWTFRLLAKHLRQAGYNNRRVVLVGASKLGVHLASGIQRSPEFGMQVVGFFDDRVFEPIPVGETQIPILGKLVDLENYLAQNQIDIVYLALSLKHSELIHQVVNKLKERPVSVFFVPDIYTFDLLGATVQEVAGMPVIGLRQNPIVGENMILKRFFDLVFSTFALIASSPVLVLISLGIKLTSPKGPVIFRQRRHGIRGEEIIVYKFRTMHVCEDGDQVKQATPNDNRITPFGAFLRKTSLDELPQFFNVLQGSMSVVGPRPHALAHNNLYAEIIDGYSLRHLAKPGITGWAQVNGCRGETSRVEDMLRRVEYDLHYLHHWSLMLDLKIVYRTFWQLLANALHLKKEKMAY